MKEPVIVVPSYWTKGSIPENDVIYDHPTDLLNPRETISKTLSSFENITGTFDILVIGCPTRASIGDSMDKTILEIINNCDLPFRVKYFGYKEFRILESLIRDKLSDQYSDLISNQGYGNVRNLCLLVPHLLGYNIAILIDDDEIVTDQAFLQKATEFVGTQINNQVLGLIVGFYKNSDGSIFVDDSNVPWWNLVWEKEKLMNEAFHIITDAKSERLVDTPFAFGGNLVIHRDCWEQVPFDPYIARGEDMDFLRNVKHFGFDTKLDKTLFITHEPPNIPSPHRIKFHQDIRRFLYSKYKLEHMKLDAADFDPYPGYFLQQTEGKVILTEFLEYIFENKDKLVEIENVSQFVNHVRNINYYFDEIQEKCRNASGSYFEFQKKWKNLLAQLNKIELPSNIILEL